MRQPALTGVASNCVRRLRGQPVDKQSALFVLPSDPVSAASSKYTSGRCSCNFDSGLFV